MTKSDQLKHTHTQREREREREIESLCIYVRLYVCAYGSLANTDKSSVDIVLRQRVSEFVATPIFVHLNCSAQAIKNIFPAMFSV